MVLKEPEEDAHHSIALDIMLGAFLEEDISFVEQDNGVPHGGHLEYLAQFRLQLLRVGAQLSNADRVERAVEELGDSLCRQGLACTWLPMQEKDAASALE